MARTIKEIYDEMIAEKESTVVLQSLQPNISSYQSLMSDLTSQAKVAVWRLIFFVVAVSIWTLEKLFDEHKAWIERRAKEIITGNTYWYQRKALEFQYGQGHALVFNGKKFVYPTIDENAQIIAHASATELTTGVLIKVAKENNGILVPLDPLEKTAFDYYIHKIKFAGIVVLPVTRLPDLIRMQYRIYIDPTIINTNGESVIDASIRPVDEAIHRFIQNLPFDGIFSITELTDKIQEVEGVINPINESCDVKYGSHPYQPVGDFYNPEAGYMEVDSNHPLLASITYLIP